MTQTDRQRDGQTEKREAKRETYRPPSSICFLVTVDVQGHLICGHYGNKTAFFVATLSINALFWQF